MSDNSTDPRQDASTTRYSVDQMERASDLVNKLSSARRAARFYPAGHPVYDAATRDLMASVLAYLDEGTDIHLGFVEGEILMGEQLLTEDSIKLSQFTDALTELGVGSVVIRNGVSLDELGTGVRLLSLLPVDAEEHGGIAQLVDEAGLTHIQIGTMRSIQREQLGGFRMPASARASYRSSISLVHEFDEVATTATPERELDSHKVEAAVRALVDNVLENRDAMLQLAGIRDFDDYTYRHSANVAALSLALGSLISRDERFLTALGVGALLHDVGKLAVGTDVLNKRGALDDDEWERMRRHPAAGAEIVASVQGIDRTSLLAIIEHHMRYDGKGYPSRPVSHKQHLVSRIVAVADAYDAMTSRRSYSGARLPDEAMQLLVKSAGTSLDPVLVRLFVRMMGIYPPRSVVRLSSGEIAIVLRANAEQPSLPFVRVVAAPSGHVLDGIDVDLSQTPGRTITACLDPDSLNLDIKAFVG